MWRVCCSATRTYERKPRSHQTTGRIMLYTPPKSWELQACFVEASVGAQDVILHSHPKHFTINNPLAPAPFDPAGVSNMVRSIRKCCAIFENVASYAKMLRRMRKCCVVCENVAHVFENVASYAKKLRPKNAIHSKSCARV